MNERNLHIDLIEKYLDDRLEGDEIKLFDETLENNEEFVRELNDIELLITGIRKSAKTTSIGEKLARFEAGIKINQENGQPGTLGKFLDFERIKKFSWAIAASITITLVASISLLNIERTPSEQKLYVESYKPFENYGTKRAAENLTKDYWKEALAFYDNGMYQDALDRFDRIIISDYKILVNHPRYSLYKLYKGNTLMNLNRHSEAAALFQDILDDDAGMIMQAKWYLGLCYLHDGNTEQTKRIMEEIAQVEGSSYSSKAKYILSQL